MFGGHFPQPRHALLEALLGACGLYSGNLAMSPLLFYFRPKGFLLGYSQKPNLISKMSNRFELKSELCSVDNNCLQGYAEKDLEA